MPPEAPYSRVPIACETRPVPDSQQYLLQYLIALDYTNVTHSCWYALVFARAPIAHDAVSRLFGRTGMQLLTSAVAVFPALYPQTRFLLQVALDQAQEQTDQRQ